MALIPMPGFAYSSWKDCSVQVSKKRRNQSYDTLSPNPKRFKPEHEARLLTLPGEIRNLIYTFLLVDEDLTVLLKAKNPSYIMSYVCANKKILAPLVNMTQVCDLIRREFRPLWMTSQNVDITAIQEYVSAFTTRNSRWPRAFPPGNQQTQVTLRLSYSDLYWWHPLDPAVMFALRLHARFPRLRMEITSSGQEKKIDMTMAILQAFLANSHVRWLSWIRMEAFASMELTSDNVLYLVMKKRGWEPWMERWDNKSAMQRMDQLERIGFTKFPVAVGFHSCAKADDDWN
ncbi:hypothetical protein EJ04DRAFT_568626 [Polyplosphaeria fusca]|uniref:F-box domain-containing protein n=1 Tax=Polyplosphaeria fusca TaxID=682080 RepID=A0A9P4QR01_9PLEO|nr:hypothetical protein EJ04DRAFT_568626 [Polyplosphaeria fusca]